MQQIQEACHDFQCERKGRGWNTTRNLIIKIKIKPFQWPSDSPLAVTVAAIEIIIRIPIPKEGKTENSTCGKRTQHTERPVTLSANTCTILLINRTLTFIFYTPSTPTTVSYPCCIPTERDGNTVAPLAVATRTCGAIFETGGFLWPFVVASTERTTRLDEVGGKRLKNRNRSANKKGKIEGQTEKSRPRGLGRKLLFFGMYKVED